MSSTADRIFSLIKARGMEQKAFAAMIGVTDKKVSTWRTGTTQSYTKYLPQIAEVLNASVEYLVTGEEKETPAAETSSGQAKKLADALKGIGIDVDSLSDAEINRIARLAKAALED